MANDNVSDIARRHGVSVEAAHEVLRALQSTGGRQAQFNHPDLGGYGQWMPGMVMVGRMGDDALKARVAALCTELATVSSISSISPLAGGAVSGNRGAWSQPPIAEEGRTLMEPMKPMKPMEPLFKGGGRWWPQDLGEPASAGGQNDLQYAYFAPKRRLAVSRGGRVELYDTADHDITGVSQQQSGGAGGSDPVFSSQQGRVQLSELRRVEN